MFIVLRGTPFRHIHGRIYKLTDRQKERWTDGQTGRQTDKPMDRQTDGQVDGKMDEGMKRRQKDKDDRIGNDKKDGYINQ